MVKLIEFLLVEDCASDIERIQQFFKEYKVANPLNIVRDEREALQFLRRQDEQAALPDVILLSRSILSRSANDWLQHIRDDAVLGQIPIVVLTTSQEDDDTLPEQLPVNLCVCKPLNLDCLGSIVKIVDDFGFTIGTDRDKPAFA